MCAGGPEMGPDRWPSTSAKYRSAAEVQERIDAIRMKQAEEAVNPPPGARVVRPVKRPFPWRLVLGLAFDLAVGIGTAVYIVTQWLT